MDPFLTFARSEWAKLRANTPLVLDEADLVELRGINEEVSLDEVAEVYLPLSRLLNLHVKGSQELLGVSATFLGTPRPPVPFVIGLAGSVAVGKSTTARILQALLARWPDHPSVELVTTDGFLFPNAVLSERQLMLRKGFPESYDRRALLDFVIALKSGAPEVNVPAYSHLIYDVVPNSFLTITNPDIVILEGLNVLQVGPTDRLFVSDFFDFSIYVDADATDIEQWYVDRFLKLRDTAFRDSESYFHRYSELTNEESVAEAKRIWRHINQPNLEENIVPTRERATLVLEKAADHSVQGVRLRKR